MSSSRNRPPRRIGELLPGIAQQLGLEEELRSARAMASWQRLVEEQVPGGSVSRLLEVRPPSLLVSAEDAATGQELRLRSAELLEAFASAPGGQRLRELHVIVRRPSSGASGKPR
ncbi:MAG: DciA family protein [Chloroflexota bacterium]